MSGTYRDRRITHNGRPATVLQDYWENDTFEFAVIRYLDKKAPGPTIQVIHGLETLEGGLMPPEEKEEADDMAPAEELSSQEEDIGGSSEPQETPQVAKRTAKNIALPEYGPTDLHYVLSPTGKWIPRQIARKETDVALSAWIDVDYPPRSVWPVEYIADDRVNKDGKHEFLIKFLGYELNPGVDGDASNYGDWYSKEENVDPTDIREYRKKRARRSI